MDELKIKVINHLTGEISEFTVSGGDSAVLRYVELEASEKALKKAKEQLKDFIDQWMGQDDKVEAGGHLVTRVQRETRTWTRDGLLTVGIDQDGIEVVSKINMTAARSLVKEAIERGDIKPDSVKELEASAEVSTTKPYLMIK